MSPLSYAYLVEININFKQEVYVMTTSVRHQAHKQESRLKRPVGSVVIGTYQSRAGMQGVIIESICRVKEEEKEFLNAAYTKKYYDTEVLVKWEDKKSSWTRASKVICINHLSQGAIQRKKEAELSKRYLANERRRELRKLG